MLNEYSPIVSMQIGLSSRYDAVDFDYHAFAEEADRLGIAPEDQGTISIEIREKGLREGFYDDDTRRISIKAAPMINKVLSHEMQHAVDDFEGVALHDRRFWIGQIGLLSMPLAPTLAAASITNLIVRNELAAHILLGADFLGGGASIGAIIYGYIRHQNERRADEAALSGFHKTVRLETPRGDEASSTNRLYEIGTVFKLLCRSF